MEMLLVSAIVIIPDFNMHGIAILKHMWHQVLHAVVTVASCVTLTNMYNMAPQASPSRVVYRNQIHYNE